MLVFLLHVSLQLGLTWTYFRVQTHTVCCPLSLLVQCFSITGSIFPERPIHDRRNVAVNMLLRCSDGLIINMTTIMRLTLTFKGTNTHTHTPPHTHTHSGALSDIVLWWWTLPRNTSLHLTHALRVLIVLTTKV